MRRGLRTTSQRWIPLVCGCLLLSLVTGCHAGRQPTSGPSASTVSLAVYCTIAVEAGLSGLPEDGVMLAPRDLDWIEDETVAELLERAAREQKLAVSSQGSGGLKFIASIGGLAPVDGRSGWMFSVNGDYIMTGSGLVTVQPGDRVEWHYTMDSGSDLP